MKKLLNKITDMLADAALLEMGVDVKTMADHFSKAASEPAMGPLKRLLQNVSGTFADAALLEMGVPAAAPVAKAGSTGETLEENLIEGAFAEEADYDDIHKAILREQESERDIAHAGECRYGDADRCFRHAA